MAMPTPFTLPTIDIIGGNYCTLTFNTFADTKANPYILNGCTATFSFRPYIYEDNSLTRSKAMSFVNDTNYLTVNLASSDTKNLDGKYIYQIAIKDYAGNEEIAQGILFIFRNIVGTGS